MLMVLEKFPGDTEIDRPLRTIIRNIPALNSKQAIETTRAPIPEAIPLRQASMPHMSPDRKFLAECKRVTKLFMLDIADNTVALARLALAGGAVIAVANSLASIADTYLFKTGKGIFSLEVLGFAAVGLVLASAAYLIKKPWEKIYNRIHLGI